MWVGTGFVIDRSITPGELLGFYAIIGYFTGSLIGMNKTIQNALIAADRLFEIMDLERESGENQIEFKPELTCDIRFENVSFSYGTRVDVFEDFNLTIPKGQITAIIGDYNIDYFTNQSLRQHVSSVSQQLDLFAGNVVENIAVGEFAPDMERILEICKMLGLLNFIEKLSGGFNTYIGEMR